MKRLRPFFPYYGSKWRLAPKYPAPLYDTIIEPFAGSAQYATLYHNRKIVLCDLSEYVCGVWDYLIKATEADILRLPSVVRHVDDFPQLCQEGRWLIGFWLYQGRDTPFFKEAGLGQGLRWGESVKQRIVKQSCYIRHWQIVRGDFSTLSNPLATWYIDPPYQGYVGGCYQYFVEARELHDWVLSRVGQIIVCENYGAWWLPFQNFGKSKGARNGTSKEVFYHAHNG